MNRTANAPAPSVRPTGNRLFLAHDPATVWFVRQGSIDVFLASVNADGEPGTRYPIAHLVAGQAIFGVDIRRCGNLAILVSPDADAELAAIPLESLRPADANNIEPGDLLDGWVGALYSSLDNTSRPNSFLQLAPGETCSIAQGSAIAPADGVLWVDHRNGYSYFLQRQQLGHINSGFCFPVSRRGWLFAAEDSQLQSIDSRSLVKRHDFQDTLQQFHQFIIKYLWASQEDAEARARQRLQATEEADAVLIDDALHRLCVSEQNGRRRPAQQHSSQDPTFLACQAVGKHMGIDDIKPGVENPAGGLKPPQAVEAIARASFIRIRRVVLDDLWWKHDSSPMIAFYESDGRAVALLPRFMSGYNLYDPMEQRSIKMTAEVAAQLQPFAYCLYRSFPAKSIKLPDLIAFGLRFCQKEVFMILLAGVASGLLGLIVPLCIRMIFDSVIPSADRSQLAQIAVFLVACSVSNALFLLARAIATVRLQIKLDAPLQAAVWDRLLSLPVPFFRGFTSGDLAQRTMGFDEARQELTGQALATIMSAIFSAFSFALLFYYSWQLALIGLLLTLIAIAVTGLFGYLQLRFFRQITKLQGALNGIVVQLIGGIAKLRVSGSEHRAFAVWAREFGNQEQLSYRRQSIANWQSVFTSIFSIICSLVLFNYASDAFSGGAGGPALTPGQFLAFVAAFGTFMSGMLQLSSSVSLLASIVPLVERTGPILHTLPETEAIHASPGVLAGAIEIGHVFFRYHADLPLVLKDVSFRVEAGQFVAIVGSSGSGKSSLMRLLLGFEQPESGGVYYDGQDLSGLDVKEVRRQMGVVLQGGSLMRGSILQNIIGSAPLALDDAMEAARLAGIDADIQAMPMGMHTHIGEGGDGLSGGQRQRLLIARAIVRRPRILLFDEATSALDNESQAKVSRSLERLEATRIVIAHRLSTVINADRIFVLENGVLVQSGTYEQLMNEQGVFKELAGRQLV